MWCTSPSKPESRSGERPAPTFDIEVHRVGSWWMVRVPDLAGRTTSGGEINVRNTTQACTKSQE